MTLSKTPIYGGFFDDILVGIECKSKHTKLLEVDKKVADEIIRKNHYSKKPCSNSFVSFIVEWRGATHGALQVGYGIRNDKKDTSDTAEFDRMWLSDDMPKFSETNVISMLHKFLKLAHPNIKRIWSYADESAGNPGTIYKAANYRHVEDIPVDFYLLPDGERVHPVSMWHRHGTRKKDVLDELYPGIKHLKNQHKQRKFEYVLSKL